jgi:hypothetical protein
MQVVESFTQLAVSAGNAAIGIATLKQQASMAGIGMVQNMTGGASKDDKPEDNEAGKATDTSTQTPPVTHQTQPTMATINDPAVLEASKVLQLVNALQLLVSGGPKGGPDWDTIRDKVSSMLLPVNSSTISHRRKPTARNLAPCMWK